MENDVEGDVVTSFYCIGVTLDALIIQLKQKNIQFCRIKWGPLSACMTSSFFEYTVQMREELIGNTHYYQIMNWISVKPRIDTEKEITLATYVKNLKKIVRQSFFVLLKRETTTLKVEDYFTWDIYCKGLSTSYISNFSIEDTIVPVQIEGEKQMTVAAFWRQFDEKHGEYIDSVTRRFYPTIENTQLNDLNSIFRLVNQWWCQPHIYGYFKNHILDMKSLHYISQYNDTLQLSLANQPTGTIHDLHHLHLQLRDIVQEKPIYSNLFYYDMASLFQFTLRDKLHHLLNYYFDDHVSSSEKRLQIMNTIIVPQLMATFEKRATLDASTCYPITLKSILFYYNRLFSISLTDEDYTELMPLTVHSDLDVSDSCTLFTKDHYSELIASLVNGVKNSKQLLEWRQLYNNTNENEEIVIKSLKTQLFVIISRPDELEQEKECYQLMMEKNDWIKELRSITSPMSESWQVDEWNQSFRQLDDIDCRLYDLRVLFLQFTPIEYRNNIDLHKMKDILFSDLFLTSIIRPANHYFTQKRLLLYFNQYRRSIGLNEVKLRIHDIGDPSGLKETCIIPDVHLYNNYDLLTLLKWLYTEKSQVKRLVFINTIDMIPLHCRGHAFLNILQYYNESEVRLSAFRFTDLSNQFCQLLDLKTSVIHQFSQLSSLQDLLTRHFKNDKMFKLQLIVQEKTLKYKSHSFEELIREHLNLKFVALHELEIERTTVSQIALKNTMFDAHLCHYIYIVRQEDLIEMNRNAWNHLLLMTEKIFILTSSGVTNLKWLKKKAIQCRVPNMRYTFPFLLDKL